VFEKISTKKTRD